MVQSRGVTKFKIKHSKTTHRFRLAELAFCMERRKVDRENRTPLTNSLNEGIFSHQSHQNVPLLEMTQTKIMTAGCKELERVLGSEQSTLRKAEPV